MNLKQKKRLVIVVVIIVIVLAIPAISKYNRNKELEKNADKFMSLLDFQDKAEIDNEPTEPYKNHESPDLHLVNRLEFLDCIENEENGLIAISILAESFEFIPLILSDVSQYDTDRYYATNRGALTELYGLDKLDLFEGFISDIEVLGEFKKYVIDTTKIKENGNNYSLEVELIGSEGTVVVTIRILIKDEIKMEGSLFWGME